MTKRYALVTGACSGIGREIARELARRGHPLLLVSNREAELQAVADEVAEEFHVDTRAVQIDLARPDAARDLYEEVHRCGIEVEILVSNAGMFFFGEVTETDPVRAETMLQLHVVTPSILARYFGQDMRSRRSGHILFVSSISAWRDFPGIALYGSSKRYLRSFSTALREELRVWGVNVTCLAPGAVATGLYAQTGVPVETAVRYGVMKHPSQIAQAGVEGMFRRKAEVVPGFSARIMASAMAHTPGWVVRLIREHTGFLPRPDDGKRARSDA